MGAWNVKVYNAACLAAAVDTLSGVLMVSLTNHWRYFEQGCWHCQFLSSVVVYSEHSEVFWVKHLVFRIVSGMGGPKVDLWAVSWLIGTWPPLDTSNFCILTNRGIWEAWQESAVAFVILCWHLSFVSKDLFILVDLNTECVCNFLEHSDFFRRNSLAG